MSAHLRDLYRPKCGECGAVAKVQLYNTLNAPLGSFCLRHGKRRLATLLKREQEAWDQAVRNNGRVGLSP